MPVSVYSLQVTLSIELNDSQLCAFEKMIPVQLAQPPWNYTRPLRKEITVCVQCTAHVTLFRPLVHSRIIFYQWILFTIETLCFQTAAARHH